MQGQDNIVPYSFKKGEDRAREAGRKGGLASGRKRATAKAVRAKVCEMLAAEVTPEAAKALDLPDAGVHGDPLTVYEALALKQVQRAMGGDIQSFAALTAIAKENEFPDAKAEEKDERHWEDLRDF